MKELEDKIMAEVLHAVHDHDHSLLKVREIVKECLERAFGNGYIIGKGEFVGKSQG